MNAEAKAKGVGASRMVLGSYLVLMGGLVLADNLGYEIPGELWSYWPFLLLGLGTVMLVWPGEHGERRNGYWLVVAGTYGLVSVFKLFGLRFSNAWPIFLIAFGVLLVYDSWRGGAGQREGDREL